MTVIETITAYIQKRKEDKIYPYSASVFIIKGMLPQMEMKEFKREISRLLKENIIELYPTINGYNIRFKDE